MTRDPDARPIAPGVAYGEGVASGRWQDDPAQRAALAQFDRIFSDLTSAPGPSWWKRFKSGVVAAPKGPVKGLYLWGGVGRGKTFLVDLFAEHLPLPGKRRVHFHRFMGEVHARLKTLGERSDPLADVGAEYAEKLRVLCLDEFFVSDIGDAMILGRLMEQLFNRGVSLITTSNTVPSELYRDGLQRARFLPAIALLQKHCVVHRMDSVNDYRLRTLTQAPVYQTPLGESAAAAINDLYERLTADTIRDGEALLINERLVENVDACEGVAWFEFAALCEGPRSVADYIEIARDFHTVLVANVPQFDATREDPAKRFIHMVDEFYDRSVNLVLSAAATITELYQGARHRHEFQRTESRLIEMQSETYLAREHRP